jgi:hypothetical protein
MDKATFLRRQSKGAYKGQTWETHRAADAAYQETVRRRDEADAPRVRAANDAYFAHYFKRKQQKETLERVFRPIVSGLTAAGDVAAEVAPYLGTVGKVAGAAYRVFAPPGSKHYKPTWREKFASIPKEAIGMVGLPKSLGGLKVDTLRAAMPSAARGGRVVRTGNVRVHKSELIVRKAAAPRLIKLLKRTGVALPLSAIRAKSKSR